MEEGTWTIYVNEMNSPLGNLDQVVVKYDDYFEWQGFGRSC